jgi:hypothetical protein
MLLAGLLVTVLGFVVSLLSLGFATSVGARMTLVLAGIATSLVGILGLINSAYLKHAIWKR